MNVKFIQLTSAKFSAVTYDASKYQGLFVHLTENVVKGGEGDDKDDVVNAAGLYYGGTSSWEMLTNSTDPDAVAKVVAAKIATLDKDAFQTVEGSTTDGVVTLTFKGISETDGIIAQGEGTDAITFAKVATTGDATDITFSQYPEETSETPLIANGANLQDVMEAVIDSINDITEDSVVALYDKDGNVLSGDAAEVKADGTTYTLKQGTGADATTIAKFNIVKDSFVKSGAVVYGKLEGTTFTEETAAKDGSNAYIKLQLSTTDGTTTTDGDTIYIPAASLIEYSSVASGDLYLSSSEDHVISVTDKVKNAITKVEGLTVNGQTVADDGTVTISAKDIIYDEGTSAGESDDVTVAQAIKSLEDNAYEGVENASADQYVKVSELADNKQTLSVTVGSFTVPATADSEEVAQVKGLATVEAVEKVITDNEKVTSTALNDLDTRVTALEDADPVVTTVTGDSADALSNTGVNVVTKVTEASDSDNDHQYTVSSTAELVWLTDLPE